MNMKQRVVKWLIPLRYLFFCAEYVGLSLASAIKALASELIEWQLMPLLLTYSKGDSSSLECLVTAIARFFFIKTLVNS